MWLGSKCAFSLEKKDKEWLVYFLLWAQGAWQPSLNISTVLTSIRLLLTEPNPDDGLMCEVVSLTWFGYKLIFSMTLLILILILILLALFDCLRAGSTNTIDKLSIIRPGRWQRSLLSRLTSLVLVEAPPPSKFTKHLSHPRFVYSYQQNVDFALTLLPFLFR